MKMRSFWPLLMAGSVGAMGVQAQTTEHYQLLVGSYTAGQSQGIYRLQFDSRTGQLDANPLQVIKTHNPSWLTLSKDMTRLFVVNENGPGQKDPVGKVSSYAIDPKTHELSPINQVQSLGNEPTHSSLSHDGQHLLVSNYSVLENPGGTLVVLPVGADGKLRRWCSRAATSRVGSIPSGRSPVMCIPRCRHPMASMCSPMTWGRTRCSSIATTPRPTPNCR